jgi:hypothetical protein
VEEIVALVFQILIEVGLQMLGGAGFDYAASRRRRESGPGGCGCSWPVFFLALGGACGGLSLLVAPNLILPGLALRIANLVVAPLLAGGLSYLIAANLWGEKSGEASEHFWRGFCFALAFGIVRFAYAHR